MYYCDCDFVSIPKEYITVSKHFLLEEWSRVRLHRMASSYMSSGVVCCRQSLCIICMFVGVTVTVVSDYSELDTDCCRSMVQYLRLLLTTFVRTVSNYCSLEYSSTATDRGLCQWLLKNINLPLEISMMTKGIGVVRSFCAVYNQCTVTVQGIMSVTDPDVGWWDWNSPFPPMVTIKPASNYHWSTRLNVCSVTFLKAWVKCYLVTEDEILGQ